MSVPLWAWVAVLAVILAIVLLADLMHRFVQLEAGQLEAGLAAILVFLGATMPLIDVWKVPTGLSPAVIATCVTVAVVAILRATRRSDALPGGVPDASPTPSRRRHPVDRPS
jgi:tellurite resistance protein TerC